ncbi:unnamed protein product, partial [Medioppia subpectinata]
AVVLKDFNLHVIQGKIFALLGPNGCGKTSLLKIILGRVKPNDGCIRVFGLEPGHKDLDIPGPGVGYMPQEIALFDAFTIDECLHYFGTIYKMKKEIIDHRIEQLIELLDLPQKSRKINELSGGQQRLVSMASTIVHRPRLLILDEPTVGVDSILRHRIWTYLENICKNYGITVLITTHYIEEAKNASNVGFVSNGSLLRQSNPHKLIDEYNCQTLEEVFLKLTQQHYKQLKGGDKQVNQGSARVVDTTMKPRRHLLLNTRGAHRHRYVDISHMRALFYKSYIQLKGVYISLILFFILPVITIYGFSMSVGGVPLRVRVGLYTGADRDTYNMSQQFIHSINESLLSPTYYEAKQAAIDSVVAGKNMFALIYPVNYSENMRARLPDPFNADIEVLNNSVIREYVDHSNTITSVYVRYLYFIDGLLKFMRKIGAEDGLNPVSFSLPIDWTKPIFSGSFF